MRHWSNPIAIAKIAISFDLPKAFGRFQRKEVTNGHSRI